MGELEILNNIVSEKDSIKGIIFIDGDNINLFTIFQEIPFIKLLLNSNKFRLFFTYSKQNTYHKFPKDLLKYKSVIYSISLTECKDSADLTIAMNCSYLDNYLPNNIIFYIITRDKFASVVSDNLKVWNKDRICHIIDNREKCKDLLIDCVKSIASQI